MVVLGIYGSPREGGNTAILLDKALEGAQAAGASIQRIRCGQLKISGCNECGACEKTGECIVDDQMQQIYPLLEQAMAIIIAMPVFFYGPPAQAKALIDRCQAMWSRRMLTKPSLEERKRYDSGKGYLISVGATKGKNLFVCMELVAKYFFDALDMSYEGGLMLRGVEAKAAVASDSEALKQAYELGRRAAAG